MAAAIGVKTVKPSLTEVATGLVAIFLNVGAGLEDLAGFFDIAQQAANDFSNALETNEEGLLVLSGGLLTFLAIGLKVTKALDEAFGNMYDDITNKMVYFVRMINEVNLNLAQMAVQAALAKGPVVASLEDMTIAANKLLGVYGLINNAILIMLKLLGEVPPIGDMSSPRTGQTTDLSTGIVIPPGGYIPAATGFYSPKLSSDTLFQAHKGERVSITPAAQNSGGSKTTIWNVTIKEANSPESAAINLRKALDDNTYQIRSYVKKLGDS